MGAWSQISGRYLLLQKNFSSAEKVFNRGLNLIRDVSTLDVLYLRKWSLVSAVMKSGPSQENRTAFEKLKALATEMGDFETVRDCDFLIYKYFNDDKLGRYCFVGTPFESFRSRFERNRAFAENDFNVFLTSDGIQCLEPHGKSERIRFLSYETMVNAFQVRDDKILVQGNLLGRTLKALLSDFYRPMTTQRLFENLFNGDHWNPYSSPVQIRQALFRLRRWLRFKKMPLAASEKSGYYRLTSGKKSTLTKIKLNPPRTDLTLAECLLSEFQNRAFSFQDFQIFAKKTTKQQVSLRTHRRWFRDLLLNQKIEKTGNTKSAKFKNKIADM